MARGRYNNSKDKLSRKEKQDLRKENEKIQQQIKTIVLPTLGVVVFLIFVYVFMKTRSFANIASEFDNEGGEY
jgi:hypothetical protein